MRSMHIRTQGNHCMHHGCHQGHLKPFAAMSFPWEVSSGGALSPIGLVYGSVLVIITLMYLSGMMWARYVELLIRGGGNYWGPAWLSSQGHLFFFCSDRTTQQGFSSTCISRTPWLSPLPSLSFFHFELLSLFEYACMDTVHVCLHIYMCLGRTYAGKRECVSCVVLSAANKRRTWFLLFFLFLF